MTFVPAPDYWLEIPAGRYRIGLTRDEARALAAQSAAWTKRQGVDLSPNEGKMMRKAAEMLGTTGDPKWVEEYLLEQYPARDVELPAFAIGKRPLDNRLFKKFMADTDETEQPSSWKRAAGNDADDRPASGLSWWQAVAVAEWAGARLPFAHEWERAVRGLERRVFAWGNTFAPLGEQIQQSYYPKTLPIPTTRTAEGLAGALAGQAEWSGDVSGWARVELGKDANVIPFACARAADELSLWKETTQVRLVRADGRHIAGAPASTPPEKLAAGQIRGFESKILVPVMTELRRSKIAEDHAVEAPWELPNIDNKIAGSPAVWKAVCGGMLGIRALSADPAKWFYGPKLVAHSRETIRRHPVEHGIFIWAIHYRVAGGEVRARPVSAFRMAFDKGIHRFDNRFRPNEPDTALSALKPELVRASILDAFQYYEIHADSDENPF